MKEKYYSESEVDEIMYSYIRKTAKELKIDTFDKKISSKNTTYV